MNKNTGRALIITGILLQTFAETPLWLTLCFVTSGFVWMAEPDFGEEDECEEE